MTTLNVSRQMSVGVELDTVAEGSSVFVTANGARVLEFTKDGYMRRLRDVPAVGLRRLPDSRIAIKPKKVR